MTYEGSWFLMPVPLAVTLGKYSLTIFPEEPFFEPILLIRSPNLCS